MIVLFAILALLCEIVGTVGGFGSSVFFVPLSEFFFSLKVVLGLTSILHVASNLAKIFLFGKHTNFRLLLLFGIPGVIGVIVGAFFIVSFVPQFANLFLALLLVVFSLVFYFKPKLQVPATNINAVTGGSISGFLAGFVGTGGAVRGACLISYNLEKSVFIATSAAIDMGVDFSRAVIYLSNGFIQKEHFIYIPLLVAAAFIGSYIGKLILKRIPQESFRTIVLLLIFIIGLITLVKSVQQ